MAPSDVLEAKIRAAVIRTLTRSTPVKHAGGQELSALDEFMWDVDKRDVAFRCAMNVCEEDSLKRRSVAELLLMYVVAFAPSEALLEKLVEFCTKFRNPADSSCPFLALHSAAETIRKEYRIAQASATHDGHGPALTPVDVYRGLPDGGRPVAHYLQQQPMQPSVRDRNRRHYVLGVPSAKEWAGVAEEKNNPILERYPVRNAYHVARCKDYVDQRGMHCSEALLEQQLRVLQTYFDNYRSHPLVARATSFFVKMWCDAYVAKLPLVSSKFIDGTCDDDSAVLPPLRFVTVSFASTLLKLMESEYFCVRSHVYDMILTFAMHLPLMDSQDTFHGFTVALSNEVAYLLCLIVQRQVLLETTDERLLLASLKCCLVVLKREQLCCLDHRSLKAFLNLSGISHSHPHIYLLLTEAFAVKVLRPDGQWEGTLEYEGRPHCGFAPIDEAAVADVGWSLHDILSVYLNCTSAASRLHMMCVLFAIAAHQVALQSSPKTVERNTPSPALMARSAKALADLNFHWHLQALMLYQSHRTFRELPSHISVDLGMKETREVKLLVVAVVQQFVNIMERFHTLPSQMRRSLSVATTMVEDPERCREILRQLCAECKEGIPSLLKDDACSQRLVATTLLTQVLRLCKPLFDTSSADREEAIAMLRSITCHTSIKVRSIVPEVLGGLWFLMRSQPAQAMGPFLVGVRLYLSHETSTANLLRLAHHLLDGLAADWSFHPSLDGDVCSLLLHGHKVPLQSTVDTLGVPVLWALYWGLRRGAPMAAACRTRLVVLSLLSSVSSHLCSTSTAQMTLWSKVMSDPYPPAALIGAQRVMRIAGLAAYDKYEAAINDAQRAAKTSLLSNTYAMAVRIWERVETDTK
jgi:hypothetical protein